ncbi:unnamed protein product [Leptosia nina]|uniref:Uncharacterized protein n=1 Tax=Leptosia nina TaxID=320188 RepID=A0AAV1K0B7_9NEOP
MYKIILFPLICMSLASRHIKEKLENDALNYVAKYNISSRPTTTGRSLKGEMVVEKFVDTLMASERYLKMVETVEKKISHLDATFHDRSNSILKYLAEVLRVVKSPPGVMMEETLRSLKLDLERIKQSVAEKLQNVPTMRGKTLLSSLF